jgi:hypothetical protein
MRVLAGDSNAAPEEHVVVHERVEVRIKTHPKCTNKVANIANQILHTDDVNLVQKQDHDPGY